MMERVILVGLPGSGKSTIGRQLARRRELPFFDSDQIIESRLGETIRAFFAREGEKTFRDFEERVIDELTCRGAACWPREVAQCFEAKTASECANEEWWCICALHRNS